MQTLEQIKSALGVGEDENVRIYSITVEGNPFVEVSKHATADVRITQLEGDYYAATAGTISEDIAVEIV